MRYVDPSEAPPSPSSAVATVDIAFRSFDSVFVYLDHTPTTDVAFRPVPGEVANL